ncbi:type III-E CRISPR-associated protein Csx30 [Desulfocurvibacter africanus]|uniref:DUF4384 domain-containing protein n=1 Tax=Desulfocurvibacter africanus subsp. africanus str. Walvis Bay TaxID=690850 RepID=F3YVQ4_DESAF|nr:type III-E CRISPR-associated protein Csx30 [Desulfocurvibacter africanus]EGJ48790.1 hypothetical protein Desaf_0435 [Desulfocurvibacter africanus subsp. africanus str. Walvis Bay]
MSMSYEPRQFQDQPPRYSRTADLLIVLGRMGLLGQGSAPEREDLRHGLDAALAADPADLARGGEVLGRAVEEALASLCGDESFLLQDGTDEYLLAEALASLDHLVFLEEGLAGQEAGKALGETLAELAQRVLAEVTGHAARLIPHNGFRLDMVAMLPAGQLHRFPWYTLWADVPEDALERLAAPESARAHAVGADEDLPADLRMALLQDLSADRPLARELRMRRRIMAGVVRAFAQHKSLGMLRLAREANERFAVPDSVPEDGLAAAAMHAWTRPPASEGERHERLFLYALCGPFLEARLRLDLFEQVEAFLRDPDAAEQRPGSPLAVLAAWMRGEVGDDQLSATAFAVWDARLARAAQAGQGAEVTARQFQDHVRAAAAQPIRKTEAGEPTPSFIAKLRQTLATLLPRPALRAATAGLLVAVLAGSVLLTMHLSAPTAPIGTLRLLAAGEEGQFRGGAPRIIEQSGEVMLSGERFQVRFTLEEPAHAYVFFRDAQGEVSTLFAGRVEAGEHVLPSPGESYVLDEETGSERVVLVLAAKEQKKLEDIEALLHGGEVEAIAERHRGVSVREIAFSHK